MKRWEIRLSGTGGQGLITAGIILAEAAVIDGKEVVQSQSYGPEARGGASKAEVIIDKTINYPKVILPDMLLAMSPQAIEKYGSEIKENGLIIIDSSLIENYKNKKASVLEIPITRLAREEIGKSLVANIIAVASVVGLTNVVSEEALKKAVLNRIPKGTEEINLKALDLGLKWQK